MVRPEGDKTAETSEQPLGCENERKHEYSSYLSPRAVNSYEKIRYFEKY